MAKHDYSNQENKSVPFLLEGVVGMPIATAATSTQPNTHTSHQFNRKLTTGRQVVCGAGGEVKVRGTTNCFSWGMTGTSQSGRLATSNISNHLTGTIDPFTTLSFLAPNQTLAIVRLAEGQLLSA